MTLPARLLYRFSDGCATAWFIVVNYSTLMPPPELPTENVSDKLLHFVGYAVLAFFAVIRRKSVKSVALFIIAIVLYGGFIEIVQPHVNRYGEFGDFVANSVGAVSGALIVIGLFKLNFFEFE